MSRHHHDVHTGQQNAEKENAAAESADSRKGKGSSPETEPLIFPGAEKTAGQDRGSLHQDDRKTAETDGGSRAAGPGGEAEAGSPGAKELGPEEKIACLEAELADANDQYLRKAADFENFRKRMNQEKQSAIDFANQGLLMDLIPVIDDFERAIKAAEAQREAAGQDTEQISAGFNSLCEGISMIEKRLVSQMENKWGLKRFDSAGETFDPNRHEAIMMEKSSEINDPVVAEDFIKGYTLKDRVVRAAKVKVIMPENAGQ
ncbi:MAG: nucleotide exchange factor GrpE [Treponema sp.]|nr:nucleotide exchange factor GrpE [Treponema sp.]